MDQKAVLSFFRDVESMEIPTAAELPRGRANGVIEVALNRKVVLPWQTRSVGLTREMVRYHLVYLGCTEMKALVTQVLASIDPEATVDPELLARMRATGTVGTLVLDWLGRPVAGSLSPASFIFGARRLRAGKTLEDLTGEISTSVLKVVEGEFGDASVPEDTAYPQKDRQSENKPGPDEKGSGKRPPAPTFTVHETVFDAMHLFSLSKRLLAVLGLEGSDLRFRIQTVERRRPKGKAIPAPDFSDAILNSFYLDELDRVLDRGQKEGLSAPLEVFLGPASAIEARTDLLTDSKALAGRIRPERLSAGRWPANPNHSLTLAQQIAVGAAIAGDELPLTAINGPPGTGKTTLLRDVIADAVVTRAHRLAKLSQPNQAFKTYAIDDRSVDLAHPSIVSGTAIVVASNNNAAVENISKELPALSSIDVSAFPQARFLDEVANDVATALKGKPECWGLLALPLGKKDNIHAVFQGLDRLHSYDDKPQPPHGLIEHLSRMGPLHYSDWPEAKRTFLDLSDSLDEAIAERSKLQDKITLLADLEADLARAIADPPAPTTPEAVPSTSEPEEASETSTSKSAAPPLTPAQLRRKIGAAKAAITKLRKDHIIPDSSFLALSEPEQQIASLWVDPGFERLRSELFLAALKLHELVLRSNLLSLRTTFITIKRALSGQIQLKPGQLRRIWDTLFLISPVVSTSLASVRRLPRETGWIGHLLIDEAGQATPQSVIPALNRAEKAVIIGDPLQIEPVFTVPAPVVERLRRDHDVERRFSPVFSSAQSVADSTMEIGAWVPRKIEPDKSLEDDQASPGERVWTGLPLRVHRRCIEPMFSIANDIAYGGQMVQGTPEPTLFTDIAGGRGASDWLDIRGASAQNKVIPEEMKALRHEIERFRQAWPQRHGSDASVFVISPFAAVAQACDQVVSEVLGSKGWLRCPAGTVHRFQGREADIVFLVLGSAPGAAGARSRAWAAQSANLLNVALTRARMRIHVIGSFDDWSAHPYFRDLAGHFWSTGQVRQIGQPTS